MRVKVRAVMLQDGQLVISRERRRGVERLLLPGGRVQRNESVLDALVREVLEETGLHVVPGPLLYIAEVVGGYGVHDLNLVWLAESHDPDRRVDDDGLVAFDSPAASSIMPPIVGRIALDAQRGWPNTPQWLGNVRTAAAGG